MKNHIPSPGDKVKIDPWAHQELIKNKSLFATSIEKYHGKTMTVAEVWEATGAWYKGFLCVRMSNDHCYYIDPKKGTTLDCSIPLFTKIGE